MNLLALILSILFLLPGCERISKPPAEQIVLAVAKQPTSAPVYVALEKGLFEREGLKVKVKEHWAGKDALAEVVKGSADFCTVAETPLVFARFKDEKILIVATITGSREYMKILARRDRGISGPKDLAGKNIGVTRGTNAEYFMDAFLTFNGLSRESVRITDFPVEDMADALESGKIDAAVSWNPHFGIQQRKLGGNGIKLANQLIYSIDWNIAGRRDYIATHHGTVEKLLRALAAAEDFINKNPAESRRILAHETGIDSTDFADYDFNIRLDQSLLINLENQARWAVRNRLVPGGRLPDFLSMISCRGLGAIRPGAVSVIHR